MKKIIRLSIIIAGILIIRIAPAQVSVHVNIGVQPLWGPVGYDYVEYYYLPAYDAYYYVPTARFVYFGAGGWIFAPELPPVFGPVDLFSCYKVVINQPKAYLYHDKHKIKYINYKSGHFNQVVIKNSREPKYFVVKGHPNYAPQKHLKMAPGPRAEPIHMQKAKYVNPAPAPGGGKGNPGAKDGGHDKGGGGKGHGH